MGATENGILAFTRAAESSGVHVPERKSAVWWHTIGADWNTVRLCVRYPATASWVQTNKMTAAKAKACAHTTIQLHWSVELQQMYHLMGKPSITSSEIMSTYAARHFTVVVWSPPTRARPFDWKRDAHGQSGHSALRQSALPAHTAGKTVVLVNDYVLVSQTFAVSGEPAALLSCKQKAEPPQKCCIRCENFRHINEALSSRSHARNVPAAPLMKHEPLWQW